MRGYPTVFNGVIFIETPIVEGQRISAVSADLSFKFGAQLKNLNDVKSDLARQATSLDCNCVCEFTYGQKSRWLAIDDVAYFGGGVAAKLSAESYRDIIEYIRQRDSV
ncbi:MAG: hypothetical protein LBI44_00360 [Oscillospiraceae bacterium]|jgi:hypothetical protein|nr:hypothetical protein [Oscillospiraceae bacterium]